MDEAAKQRKGSVKAMLIAGGLGCLLSVGCAPPPSEEAATRLVPPAATSEPAIPAYPTTPATATNPPKPTAPVYPTVVITGFPVEMRFFNAYSGAGHAGSCGMQLNEYLARGGTVPGIGEFVRNTGAGEQFGRVCVYGLEIAVGEQVGVALATQEDTYIETLTLSGGRNGQYTTWDSGRRGYVHYGMMSGDSTPILEIGLWLPAAAPADYWRLRVQAPRGSVEGVFAPEAVHGTLISTSPERGVNPLSISECASFAAGQTVYVRGEGFVPEQRLELTWYHLPSASSGETGSLLRTDSINTTENGRFVVPMLLEEGLEPGYYRLVLIDDLRQPGGMAQSPEVWAPLYGPCLWIEAGAE